MKNDVMFTIWVEEDDNEERDLLPARITDGKTGEVLWEGFVKNVDYDCLGKR